MTDTNKAIEQHASVIDGEIGDRAGERLSSLVDGELSSVEYEHAVKAVEQDVELKRRWERYHIAADSLKNNLPPLITKSNFADRVMLAIESEPTVFAPRNLSRKVNSVVKQVAGLAVAASVTAAAVFGVQSWQGTEVAAPVAQVFPPMQPMANPSVTTVADTSAQVPENLKSQLNNYLLNHNQSVMGFNGMLPYARIVGYSTSETAE